MMSKSGVAAFDNVMIASEATRQQAVNLVGATQAQVNTANITFYRDAVSNGVANSIDVGPFIFALKNLGATP
jgi:hypothetical protein